MKIFFMKSLKFILALKPKETVVWISKVALNNFYMNNKQRGTQPDKQKKNSTLMEYVQLRVAKKPKMSVRTLSEV